MQRSILLLVPALLAGCATLTDTNQQTVLVQAVQDNREVGGVGCILANKAGRWFVTAPGRVTIQRSIGDLTVDCKKEDVGTGFEVVASKINHNGLWGNLVISAGLGYVVDKQTGAAFDYPSTLTVIMRAPEPAKPDQAEKAGTIVY